jgi:hypothetical protein
MPSPSDKALQKIADLEIAIGAVESIIEDEAKVHSGPGDTEQR